MIAEDVVLGAGVSIPRPELVNLYGCTVGDGTRIGAFVEIQRGVYVGERCKVSSHSFLCDGVTVEDEVFIGHGVMFTNDRYPRATVHGHLRGEADWTRMATNVGRGASIGSGAVILPGVTIGAGAMVGGGAVVAHDVPDHAIVVGRPAHVVGDARDREPAEALLGE